MSRKDSVELYMHNLKKHLILPKNYRQSFLEGITQEMQEYANEQALCTYEHLADTFGEPELVARHFIEQSGSVELEQRTKRRKVVFRIMTGVLLALVVILAIWIISLLRHTEVKVTETITESYHQNQYVSFIKEC